MYYILGVMLLINLATMFYFVNKFEKMFIIMKASSLKDLLFYYKNINKQEEEEDIDDMP